MFSLNEFIEGGVGQMLTKADKGGRGGQADADDCWRGGEGGVWKPLKLADVICGQPLSWNKLALNPIEQIQVFVFMKQELKKTLRNWLLT